MTTQRKSAAFIAVLFATGCGTTPVLHEPTCVPERAGLLVPARLSAWVWYFLRALACRVLNREKEIRF